jgi:hypothetical protein
MKKERYIPPEGGGVSQVDIRAKNLWKGYHFCNLFEGVKGEGTATQTQLFFKGINGPVGTISIGLEMGRSKLMGKGFAA